MRKRTGGIVVCVMLALVMHTLALSVLASVQTTGGGWKGKGKAIGVGVYQDDKCTTPLSSIDWGVFELGSSKNFTCYIRNEEDSASILSMYTSNWDPSNASQYIVLSWDYGGQSIDPDEVAPVTFTLSVSASFEGITSFSFDITMVAVKAV